MQVAGDIAAEADFGGATAGSGGAAGCGGAALGRGGIVECGAVDEVAVELRSGISHGS